MSNDNDEKGEHANQTYICKIFLFYMREKIHEYVIKL